MPYPAYQGSEFYFEIVIGHAWRHEFSTIDRETGERAEWTAGWSATCVIRDQSGVELATLASDGTGDGTVSLESGLLVLELVSDVTATLPPTTTYQGVSSKPFHYADIAVIDPGETEPYVVARGKGVAYLPTTA